MKFHEIFLFEFDWLYHNWWENVFRFFFLFPKQPRALYIIIAKVFVFRLMITMLSSWSLKMIDCFTGHYIILKQYFADKPMYSETRRAKFFLWFVYKESVLFSFKEKTKLIKKIWKFVTLNMFFSITKDRIFITSTLADLPLA